MAQSKLTKSPSVKELFTFLNGLVDDIGGKLATTGKAADADKLDGHDSTYFSASTHSHTAMTGASTNTAGKTGFVPAPGAGAATRYLRSDGTWATPPDTNTTYGVVSTTANGLCPKRDGTGTKVLAGDGSWKAISSLVSASTTGGIVAQSLGQNGYVKFANGLILQWGLAKTDSNYDIGYVLPVTTPFLCICSDSGSDMDSAQVPQIVGLGTLGFRAYEIFVESHKKVPIQDAWIYWILLGK